MHFDMDNPVMRLCADGMMAEGDGRPDDARASFEVAWAARRDDFDAAVAAHYVARHADDLAWNLLALRHALAAPPHIWRRLCCHLSGSTSARATKIAATPAPPSKPASPPLSPSPTTATAA